LKQELGLKETPEELERRLAQERRQSMIEREKTGLYGAHEHQPPAPGR